MTLQNIKNLKSLPVLLLIIVFAAIGLLVLVSVSAATRHYSVTVNNSTNLFLWKTDRNAHDGGYIRFESQWTPQDQLDITKSYINSPIIQPGQPGSMRITCLMSHFNYDDPIVFPNQKSPTHLHMFFGNSIADYRSTTDSIKNTGHGTCLGNEVNRTAYWMPALIDRSGNARIAAYSEIYYKRGLSSGTIKEFPEGLRMIAGNASANSVSENINNIYTLNWRCSYPPLAKFRSTSHTIPNCNQDEALSLILVFPQCWDGRNLDSPDHKSHMSYPDIVGTGQRVCPDSHPVGLPEITYNIYWTNSDQSTNGWYLSSDRFDGKNVPGGTTTHADWFGGWHPEIQRIFVRECNNAPIDCKGGTIAPDKRLVPTSAPNILKGEKIPISSIPK